MITGTDIVACARGWLGTRFHHQGRLKKTATSKGGVDCLGLLIGVAAELDMHLPDGRSVSHIDRVNYPHYPDTELLRQALQYAMQPVAYDKMAVGDILLLSIDGMPQHLAIVSNSVEGFGIIHAYAPARFVVEHAFDDWWRNKISGLFRFA